MEKEPVVPENDSSFSPGRKMHMWSQLLHTWRQLLILADRGQRKPYWCLGPGFFEFCSSSQEEAEGGCSGRNRGAPARQGKPQRHVSACLLESCDGQLLKETVPCPSPSQFSNYHRRLRNTKSNKLNTASCRVSLTSWFPVLSCSLSWVEPASW